MEEAATERPSRFRPSKRCIEEVSLLEGSKSKSAQYTNKWAVDVFRHWQAAREKKIPFLEPGSVQTLEERLKDLDSLSLNFWLTKFV